MAKRKSQRKKKKAPPRSERQHRRSRANLIFIAIGILMVLSVVLGPILPELLSQ